MHYNISIILTEDAHEILSKTQEHIAQKEMIKKCTQAHAITKALIFYQENFIGISNDTNS